ncbi:hypothetical protein EIN_323780 [Entamoeba invadens IP1]|uniref:Uncharacterized protein n=1 Tax=Entamoeba invadens IP1 TaxID=370355 RepID=L7FMW2_ENTIV|nr:hypothetical protein EIN_323780 [Entamoeba invadens IP1]ELP90233.1 hypothetical protein EIN_323780 [Entamoeba invadens IP1]|eukprot:XP_004257004.1 hypothetical protein EIN_323780 [Entamoeba invadens IP1]
MCLKCTDGYMFDFSTKTCTMGKELCKLYYNAVSNNVLCYQCYNNLTVYTKNNMCIDCIATNPNCLQMDTEDCSRCRVCRNGYKIIANETCTIVPNCAYTNKNSINCKSCIDGFYLENDECKRGDISDCVVYDNATVCAKCNEGLFILNGKCVNLPFCQKTNRVATRCVRCMPGYGLNGVNCSVCTTNENCTSCYANYTKCSTCVDGMYSNEIGVCVSCIVICKLYNEL